MPANRTKTGQFIKGQSGNPSGRPKQDPEVIEIIRAACPNAARRLVEFVNHDNPKIAMWAITELLDRGYGKPIQAQDISMDVSGGLDVRAQIRSILLERLNSSANEEQSNDDSG